MALWPPPATPAGYGEWLEGLGGAAERLASGAAEGSAEEATRAFTARSTGEAGARARLARGLALGASGKSAEAAVELAAAEPELSFELQVPARLARAAALLSSREPAAAGALLVPLGREAAGPLARRARALAPQALLESGDAAGAVAAAETAFAEAPADPAAPGLRLVLAAALRARREDSRAAEVYRALWLDLPAEPAGREAGRALAAWSRAAGPSGPVAPPSPGEQLARAERLVLAARPQHALSALARLPSDAGDPDAAHAHLLRALALQQLGRPAEAEAAARSADIAPAAPAVRLGARLALARAAARLGRLDEAIARYTALSAEAPSAIPGIPQAAARDLPDEAAYLSAWLLLDAGRLPQAAAALARHARERPGSPRATDARWFEAWTLRRLGRAAEARKAFARLEDGALAPAALYWHARLEPPARARPLYRRAVAAEPGGWYALLASARLAALGERVAPLAPAAAGPIPDAPGDAKAAPALARAATLLAFGLRADALAELRALAANRPAAAAAAQLALAAGDAEVPFRSARDHLALTSRTVRWAYPRAYPALLPAVAEDAGVDELLILAVMRRESSFREEARSPAGAEGLLQLLPRTADRLATLLGLPPGSARTLEEPRVSLPLGAAYLALLDDRFRDPAVVVAAYNAGPPAAAGWAKERAGRPLDEWVEEIPYRETRRYVKTVLAARAVYGWLWAGEPLALDPARPVAAPRAGVDF